jgi:hypothetical protein
MLEKKSLPLRSQQLTGYEEEDFLAFGQTLFRRMSADTMNFVTGTC